MLGILWSRSDETIRITTLRGVFSCVRGRYAVSEGLRETDMRALGGQLRPQERMETGLSTARSAKSQE